MVSKKNEKMKKIEWGKIGAIGKGFLIELMSIMSEGKSELDHYELLKKWGKKPDYLESYDDFCEF